MIIPGSNQALTRQGLNHFDQEVLRWIRKQSNISWWVRFTCTSNCFEWWSSHICYLKVGHCRPLFLYFHLFYTVDNKQCSRTGFEPRTSGVGSDRSIHWATTTATSPTCYHLQSLHWWGLPYVKFIWILELWDVVWAHASPIEVSVWSPLFVGRSHEFYSIKIIVMCHLIETSQKDWIMDT